MPAFWIIWEFDFGLWIWSDYNPNFSLDLAGGKNHFIIDKRFNYIEILQIVLFMLKWFILKIFSIFGTDIFVYSIKKKDKHLRIKNQKSTFLLLSLQTAFVA